MTLGFRILERRQRVSMAMVEKFRDLPVANVSDVMSRMTAGGAALRPLHASGVLAGAAFTVKTRPGDNLMIHKALLMAGPGDVIVVDAGGDLTNALVGELMLSHARAIGVTGVVINGAVRDYGWIKTNTFPVFAAGITHRGPYKDGPGEINVPISLGGMIIEPGDLMLGDDDGLVCVPFDQVEEVYAQAKGKNEAEAKTLANTLAGKLDPKLWVDESLKKLGCEGV
ncbi:RraA family protein [Sinorhizobium mexicanum]|uniref:Putative 4-hydroxy-4-methyl-2-oxoglutarate aldolase n=1 Tax=Sinorhizobium mexicanum TaxID=375549 RepID=A0A859QQ84_9HYPH|nr:RraA family protein [Sinorhizobium mexicanum]MBP1884671.1 regulator of RNase E activity RraA [Sinorhizobium mexicanum]QLL65565.1 RraA family protein [Sinorhizobium mexicanum]